MTAKSILLVEDNPQDEMLIFHARRKAEVANRGEVVRGGQQAFDYLMRRDRGALGPVLAGHRRAAAGER